MIIRLDFREADLHSEITKLRMNGAFSKITIETDNLAIGDIIICQDDGKEQLIIERKTLPDLAASIRDGRYNEQSFRLNQCALHNHSIVYLLEGNIHRYKSSKYGRSIIFIASNKDYTSVSKRVKKANITSDNIGSIMLAQIPSVSTASACAIMDKYKTIPSLIQAITNDDKALDDITTLTKSGKARKLTKTCTNNVYNFLLGKSGLVEVDV